MGESHFRPLPLTPQQEAHNREMTRRQELRSNYLVPIYFMNTKDVPQAEAQAALQGVTDALFASGQNRKIVNLGSQSFGQGEYLNPEWYVDDTLRKQELRKNAGYGQQLVASSVMQHFYREPWQEQPHWEVFVINRDLTDWGGKEWLNFVFGSTNTGFPASVQSITRLTAEIPAGDLRNAMIRRLLRHETGHMFGLPRKNRSNTEQKLGTHCVNVCTMRQGMSIPEWAKLTTEESKKGVHFCNDCKNDLDQVRNKYKPLPPQKQT